MRPRVGAVFGFLAVVAQLACVLEARAGDFAGEVEVDRPGHLVLYDPSTTELLQAVKGMGGLRVGVITNLPDNLTAEQGRAMIADAGLTEFLDPDAIIINHEVGVSKPNPEIFRIAAQKVGLPPAQCLFSGENFGKLVLQVAKD